MLKTRASARNPAYFGPFVLALALLLVSCISEPIWTNFYTIEAKSLNTTMKVGAWGVCTRLRVEKHEKYPAGVASAWCTPKMSGFTLKFVENTTGINQFPTGNDDAAFLLGLDSEDAIPILSSSETSVFWLHVVATVLTGATVGSLILPPSYLGGEDSILFLVQKSGILTACLGVLSCIMAFVAFAVELAIIVPAKDRLNKIDGIKAEWGNVEWYALPCALLMLAGTVSILMKAEPSKLARMDDEYPLAKPTES